MKKIIALLLVTVFLSAALTSCVPIIRYSFGDLEQDTSSNTNTETPLPDDTTETLINVVAPRLLRANVVITATHYTFVQQSSSQGSGVVFHTDARYVYILTNHHVVYQEDVKRSVYTVRDAFNNTYSATVVAMDEECDLAVVRIARSETTDNLNVATIATANAPVDTPVIAVGNPEGVHNTVSVGKIVYVKDITNDTLSVDVAYHTAPLEHGSSGGGIFDSEGRLVGINYAVGADSETGNEMSFAVPVAAIRDFLSANNLLPTTAD